MTGELAARPPVARRLLHLGGARAAAVGARALLLLLLGLALPAKTTGTVAVLLSLGAAAAVMLELGMGPFLLRQAAVSAGAIDEVGGVLALRLALFPLLVMGTTLVAVVTGQVASGSGLAVAVMAYVLAYPCQQTLFVFLQGVGRTAVEAVVIPGQGLLELSVGLGWYFVSPRDPVHLFAALAALRLVMVGALVTVLLPELRGRLRPALAWALVLRHRPDLLVFFVIALAQFVVVQGDILLLEGLRGPEAAGRYWANYRLLLMVMIPMDLLLSAVSPQLASAQSPARQGEIFVGVHGMSTIWAFAVVAGSAVHGAEISELLGASFEGAGQLLPLLGIALGVSYLPPFGAGLTVREPRLVAGTYAGGAVLNLALNLWLIPRYGAMGAAYATLATYSAMKLHFALTFRAQGVVFVPWRTVALSAATIAGWWAISRWAGWGVVPSLLLLLVAAIALLAREWRLRRSTL